MNYFKLQFGCLAIVVYIAIFYVKERISYKSKSNNFVFNNILIFGILSIIFNGITEYTVNHLDQIPDVVNKILYVFYFSSLDIVIFSMFIYIVEISYGLPKRLWKNIILIGLTVINILFIAIFAPNLQFIEGKVSNYAHGRSVLVCFALIFTYIILSIIIFSLGSHSIENHKKAVIATTIAIILGVALWQLFFPEDSIVCVCPTVVIICAYFNLENPILERLKENNNKIVSDFAILVENKDDNTGGHIHRTTEYVNLILRELRSKNLYSNILTNDYVEKLTTVSPMHDIGKIAIPDAILQKPGKLTQEEFEIMKTHTVRGGKIIRTTLSNTGDYEYEKIAYEVVMYHHEKWNGKGYPDGLSKNQIPLAARIVAVADVFDAISSRRCYRDAFPLSECFDIIKQGIGKDFDPTIANLFLQLKDEVTILYQKKVVS